MKAIGLAFVACAAVTSLAQAAPRAAEGEPTALLADWAARNSACRGGHGDDPATQAACRERDRLDEGLKAAGWCYGRIGDREYQKTWRRCAADSIR